MKLWSSESPPNLSQKKEKMSPPKISLGSCVFFLTYCLSLYRMEQSIQFLLFFFIS